MLESPTLPLLACISSFRASLFAVVLSYSSACQQDKALRAALCRPVRRSGEAGRRDGGTPQRTKAERQERVAELFFAVARSLARPLPKITFYLHFGPTQSIEMHQRLIYPHTIMIKPFQEVDPSYDLRSLRCHRGARILSPDRVAKESRAVALYLGAISFWTAWPI